MGRAGGTAWPWGGRVPGLAVGQLRVLAVGRAGSQPGYRGEQAPIPVTGRTRAQHGPRAPRGHRHVPASPHLPASLPPPIKHPQPMKNPGAVTSSVTRQTAWRRGQIQTRPSAAAEQGSTLGCRTSQGTGGSLGQDAAREGSGPGHAAIFCLRLPFFWLLRAIPTPHPGHASRLRRAGAPLLCFLRFIYFFLINKK